jgi:hypothetical protein
MSVRSDDLRYSSCPELPTIWEMKEAAAAEEESE